MKRLPVALLALLLTLLSAAPASAHRPLWAASEGVTEIPNLETSFAVYRDLAPNEVHRYRVAGRAGGPLHAGINIPAVVGLEQYGVTLAVVGPGLPPAGRDALPVEVPAGQGTLLFPSTPSEPFYEPFTQTNYWGRQTADFALPASGDYQLLVWHPDGEAGKYVMDTGAAELFGPADGLRFPVWWLRVHAFFGHTPQIVGGALALLALAATLGAGWRALRRRGVGPLAA